MYIICLWHDIYIYIEILVIRLMKELSCFAGSTLYVYIYTISILK